MASRGIDGPAGSTGWYEVAAATLALRGLLMFNRSGLVKVKTWRGAVVGVDEVGLELHYAVLRLRAAGAVSTTEVPGLVTVTPAGRAALRRRAAGFGPVQETLAEATAGLDRRIRL